MAHNCLHLFIILSILTIIIHARRHHRNWLMAAIPTDEDDDGPQLRRAMDDFLERVQPELKIKDQVFDLTTVTMATPLPTTTTSTTTAKSTTELPPHSYMLTLYEEIDERRNEKWAEMEAAGATIRGVEPIKVVILEPSNAMELEFAIGTINDMNAIHHVDLVLTSSTTSYFDENVEALEVSLKSGNETTSPMQLMTYRKMSTSDSKWSFLVLEMTPTIREWWNRGHLNSTQTIRCTSSKPLDFYLKRPLLVFYYVTRKELMSTKPRQRSKRSFSRAFVHPRTNSRPCSSRCVHAQRRQQPNVDTKDGGHRFCSLRSWDVTVHDLQWEAKVVAPYSLQMNFCAGSCEAPIYDASYNATNHAVVRSMLLTQTQNASDTFPPPYCVPTSLEGDTFMFLENDQFYIKNMDNIVAKTCGCR